MSSANALGVPVGKCVVSWMPTLKVSKLSSDGWQNWALKLLKGALLTLGNMSPCSVKSQANTSSYCYCSGLYCFSPDRDWWMN